MQANLFFLFLRGGHKRQAMTAHSRTTITSRATTPTAATAYMTYISVLLSTPLGALDVLDPDICCVVGAKVGCGFVLVVLVSMEDSVAVVLVDIVVVCSLP
jgi:NAD dependent epimerase/dehydratase family enzyme